MKKIKQIRQELAFKFQTADFVNGTIELLGESFIADEPLIFGEVNQDYVKRELEWYQSGSLNVYDIKGKVPKIWRNHATPDGFINSNYGHLIYSRELGSQFLNVLAKLSVEKETRQAVMVYTRPSMHQEWNKDGMSDFICTNAVQYYIRDNKLETVVQMRSNDVVFGYRNDYAWQRYVRNELLANLREDYPELRVGKIIWNASSLHVYERHFHLIEEFIKTGKFNGRA